MNSKVAMYTMHQNKYLNEAADIYDCCVYLAMSCPLEGKLSPYKVFERYKHSKFYKPSISTIRVTPKVVYLHTLPLIEMLRREYNITTIMDILKDTTYRGFHVLASTGFEYINHTSKKEEDHILTECIQFSLHPMILAIKDRNGGDR